MTKYSVRTKAAAAIAALAIATAGTVGLYQTQTDDAPPQVMGVQILPNGLGAYTGSGRPANLDAYETWLGGEVPWAVDFLAGGTWGAIDNPSWWLNQWAGKGHEVVYSVPMLPSTSYTLAAGANGAYNSHWRSMAEKFVAAGEGDSVLRIGWEMNGRWYPWSAVDKEASFAAYWRQIVNTIRSVPGAAFRFDWTPITGGASSNLELAYPGDAYVDIIGLDAYDQTAARPSLTPEALWANLVTGRYGLQWQRDFAAAHNKPVSFPEWGLTVKPNTTVTKEDNPHYIRSMRDWFAGSNLAYASYFEAQAGDGWHKLSLVPSQFPKSSALFKELFVDGLPTGGEPPTTTTAPTTTIAPTTTAAPTTTVAPTTTTTTAPTTTTTLPPPVIDPAIEAAAVDALAKFDAAKVALDRLIALIRDQ